MRIEQAHQHYQVLEPHKLVQELLGMERDPYLELVSQVLLVHETRLQICDTFDVLEVLQLGLRRVIVWLLKHRGKLIPELLGSVLKSLFDHAKVKHDEHGEENLLQVTSVLLLFPIYHLKQQLEALLVVLLLCPVQN